jgi:acyl carrier protein
MHALGASVRVIATDLADATQVAALVAGIVDLPALKGIFHLAVVTSDALLTDTTPTHFEQVMAGKAAGAWNLYNSTRDLDLDFCVFFSSIATLIAQPGQGAYAAANAFLDALARYCRIQNYPSHSLQWGPWIGGGLSTQAGKQRSVRAYADQGIHSVRPNLGFAILERALCQSNPVLLAAAADWRKYAEYCGDSQVPHILNELVPVKENSTGRIAHVADGSTNLREELLAADAGRPRQTLLENYLRAGLARILKLDPARVDVQKPVGSMGVDSLMAMEFVRRLSPSTGLRLPVTIVFNYPTIRALGAEIARRMQVPLDRNVAVQTTTDVAPSSSQYPTTVHELSEEEAIRSLISPIERSS